MELHHKILAEYYAEYGRLDEKLDREKIISDRCFRAICEIREILADDSLEDAECFWRIEQVVDVLEKLGLDAGTRHDYG